MGWGGGGEERLAQLVERPTEKPGAILPRVRALGEARDFSASQLSVLLRCPCNRMHKHLCAHVKNHKHWQPHHCLDTPKTLHTLIGMGSDLNVPQGIKK